MFSDNYFEIVGLIKCSLYTGGSMIYKMGPRSRCRVGWGMGRGVPFLLGRDQPLPLPEKNQFWV